MKSELPENLDSMLFSWIVDNNQADDPDHLVFDGQTNLLESGVLDSVGLLDLLAFAESKTGLVIDLAALDHDEFDAILTIVGLCDVLASRLGEPS
jgi:acyl carrier protein